MNLNIAKTKVMVISKEDKQINERLSSVIKLYQTLSTTFIGRREITRRTKANVYKTILEMKLHGRPIEITRMHRIRNDEIRRELNKEQEQNQLK